MNIIIQNKLNKVINNNLPLIQSTVNEHVLPQIQGSIQEKKNQIYAFQILHRTIDGIPVLSIITKFINEDDFVAYCMPHATKYLGTNNLTEKRIDNILDESYLQTDNNEFSSIDKLFVADELLKLKELVDINVITMDEFNDKKIRIIGIKG